MSSENESSISSLPEEPDEDEEDEDTFTDHFRYYDDYYDKENILTYTYEDVTFYLSLNSDNSGYMVIRVDSDVTDIEVPDTYNDLPIVGFKAYRNNSDGISESPFSNNESITSVTMPDTITYLPRGLFYQCTSLREVTLSSTLLGIGEECFYGCTSLTELSLPDTLKVIRSKAFASSGIEEIVIPDSVISFGTDYYLYTMVGGLFEDCTSLKSITLNDNIAEFPNECFRNCTSLTSIILPDALTEVPNHCFYQCNSLTSVTFNDNLQEIGSYAFFDCHSLSSTQLGDNLSYIGDAAFAKCILLNQVNIPDSLEEIGMCAFEGTLFIELTQGSLFKLENGFLLNVDSTEKTLPQIELPNGTEHMIDGLFQGIASLTEIDLGDDLCAIPNHAFEGCSALKAVHVPETVKRIGVSAFNYCQALQEYDFNEGLLSIQSSAFSYSGLEELSIPTTLSNMSYSFTNCTYLKKISFSTGDIPEGFATSFNNDEMITTIEIDSSNQYLSKEGTCLFSKDKDIFYSYLGNTKNITEYTFPDTVKEIHDYAFYRQRTGINLTLPDQLETIGDMALSFATYQMDITLPSTISYIGRMAFAFGSGENSVRYEGELEDYLGITFQTNNYLLYGRKLYLDGTELKDLTIDGNDGISTIGNYTFQNYKNFRSITLKNMDFISHYAFHNIKTEEKYIRIDAVKLGLLSFYAPGSDLIISDNLHTVYQEFVSSSSLISNQDKIFFEGKKTRWETLTYGILERDTYPIYYYSQEEPTDQGNYYHYVDDVPVIYEAEETEE